MADTMAEDQVGWCHHCRSYTRLVKARPCCEGCGERNEISAVNPWVSALNFLDRIAKAVER